MCNLLTVFNELSGEIKLNITKTGAKTGLGTLLHIVLENRLLGLFGGLCYRLLFTGVLLLPGNVWVSYPLL